MLPETLDPAGFFDARGLPGVARLGTHTTMLIRGSEPLLPRDWDTAGPSETESGPGERERDLCRDGGSRGKKSIRPHHDVVNGSSISLGDSLTAFALTLVDPLLRLDGTRVLSSSSSLELTVYSDPVSLSLGIGSAAARACEEGPEPEPEPEPEPAAGVATTVSSSSGSSLRLCRGCSRPLGWPCGAGFVGTIVSVCDADAEL